MPLKHSKTPAAFKRNIKTEVETGKPVKQAVAIAYSEKERAEHAHHKANGGKVAGCAMCASGGSVHEATTVRGESRVGGLAREASELRSEGKHREAHEKRDEAVELHKDKLHSMQHQKKPRFAKGGSVDYDKAPSSSVHPDLQRRAKAEHEKMRKNKNGFQGNAELAAEHERDRKERGNNQYAKGGEVEEPDDDSEMHDTVGREIMHHIKSGDHKGLMESIGAAIALHKIKDEAHPDEEED